MKRILKMLNMDRCAQLTGVFLILFYIIQAILQIAQPEILNQVTTAVEARSGDRLLETFIFAIIVTVATIIVDVLLKLKRIRFQNMILERVQKDLMERIMRFQRTHFQKSEVSDYLTGVVDYAQGAVEGSINYFCDTVSGMFCLIMCVLYMSYLSIPLTVLVVIFNLLLRLVMRLLEKKVRETVRICNQVIKQNNGFLVELLTNMQSIRIYNKEDYFNQKLWKRETETYHSQFRSRIWKLGQGDFTWLALKFAEYMLVYGVGGVFCYLGYIDFGVFLAYPIAMDYFVKAINSLMYSLVSKNSALSIWDSMSWLYEENFFEKGREDELQEIEKVGTDAIRFENVSFGYTRKDGSRHEILKDVSFSIKSGDKVLLQGPNGEGKSTLLYLISGQYRPDKGEIFYGAVPTTQMKLPCLSQNYGLITQESDLFSCDIPKNIMLNNEPDTNTCRKILKDLWMEERLEATISQLSQGEGQRVNIARALYKAEKCCSQGKRIFLLGDEILSNLDVDNAHNVLQLIKQKFLEDTVILVIHGDSSFEWNVRIVVEGGKISVERRNIS